MMNIKYSLDYLETYLGTYFLNSAEDKMKRTRLTQLFSPTDED